MTILGLVLIVLMGYIVNPVVFADNLNDTEQIIEYLISETENSGLTFIRNGKEFTSEEAASHIRKKYEYYKKKIETPDDFIRIAASKSLISGKKYYVQITDDKFVPVEEWMRHLLNRYLETADVISEN